MKIKSSGDHFYLRGMIGVTALIAVLLLFFTNSTSKNNSTLQNYQNLPEPTKAFLAREVTFEEVLDFFKEEEIYIGVKDEASQKMPQSIKNRVAKMGGKELSQLGYRASYVGYVKAGKFLTEKQNMKAPVELNIGENIIKSGGNLGGNFCTAIINGTTYEETKRGLHLYIVSKKSLEIIQFRFDFFATETPKSTGKLETKIYPNLEQLELVLRHKNFTKIAKKRAEALDLGVLLTKDEDLVNAKVIYEGQTYKVKTRLKGDWTDHLKDDKWSFRVKVEDDEAIMGMRKFSIQHPRTRNFAGEWLFHQLLQEQDILGLKYKFIQVWLTVSTNEGDERKNLGVYAIEEAFDKPLFERQNRRAGLIVKINENLMWEQRAIFFKQGGNPYDLDYIDLAKYSELPVVPFGEKSIMKDSVLKKQFLVAQDLLRAYVLGKLKASEVFDVDKLATYNVICNLFGAYHAMIPHNWRLYYNPITSKLEPIGFDANGAEKFFYLQFFKWANQDLEFMKVYAQKVEEMIKNKETWLEKTANFPELTKHINQLEKEYSEFKWDTQIFNHNLLTLESQVMPEKSLNIFLESYDHNKMVLSIENFGKMPIELSHLENQNNRVFGQLTTPQVIGSKERKTVVFELNKDFEKLFVNKKKKKSTFNINSDIYKISVIWQTYGTTTERKAIIHPWNNQQPDILQSIAARRAPTAVSNQPFLMVDEVNKTVTCRPGSWKLKTELLIPPNYTFKMGAGCEIDFYNHFAKIISYSPIQWIGTEEAPIRLYSSTNKGGGIFVVGSADTSLVNHCIFDNLGIPSTPYWSLSGAVNFFENPVKISNTIFKNNRTEDGLNIIKTWFDINQVAFSNTQSDAFDGDFVEGTIANSSFDNLGNDAIDVSGSAITIKKVIITKAGDKGLSAGENSKMMASDVLVQDCEVAIASKDLSQIIADQLVLRDNKLGFTAFQKKPEFGPCQLEATNIRLENNELNHLIERKSSLMLNGQLMPVSDGVKERMYGAEFGKSSR